MRQDKLKRLTKFEQKTFRDQAMAELEELESDYRSKVSEQRIDRFKAAFQACEKVYCIILKPYLAARGKELAELKIDMRQGAAVLRYVGYNFDEDLLNRLFMSEKFQGKKTAKRLFRELNKERVSPTMMASVEKELAEREQELFADINAFKSKIREFDQAK